MFCCNLPTRTQSAVAPKRGVMARPSKGWMSCQTVHVNFPDPRLRKSAVFSSVPMCRDGA
jgi:hypothetical protein